MRLYELTRVLEAEQTDDFRRFVTAAQKQRAARQNAVQRRKQKLLEWAWKVPLKWNKRTPRTAKSVIQKANRAWINHHEEQGDYGARYSGGVKKHGKRRARAWLRHRCITYEDRLASISSKPGVREAYAIIRSRVEILINQRFPSLAMPEVETRIVLMADANGNRRQICAECFQYISGNRHAPGADWDYLGSRVCSSYAPILCALCKQRTPPFSGGPVVSVKR